MPVETCFGEQGPAQVLGTGATVMHVAAYVEELLQASFEAVLGDEVCDPDHVAQRTIRRSGHDDGTSMCKSVLHKHDLL